MNHQPLTHQPAALAFQPVGSLLQRKCGCGQHTIAGGECASCRKKRAAVLHRAAQSEAQIQAVPPLVSEVLREPGRPLEPAARDFMEPRFGQDFSRVRIHTDFRAEESARMVNALAYTVGHHVVFGRGEYQPQNHEGRRLLAHELTHTIQQQDAGASLLGIPPKIGPANDAAEKEAERTAARIVEGGTATRIDVSRPTSPRLCRTPTPAAAPPPHPGVCGPDVRSQVEGAVDLTAKTFIAWSDYDKKYACEALNNIWTAAIAWDIVELHNQGWIESYRPDCATWTPYPRCGWFPSDPDYIQDSKNRTAASVQVGSGCHLAGSVNYVIYGVMCKLCYNHFASLFAKDKWYDAFNPLGDYFEDEGDMEAFRENDMLDNINTYKGSSWYTRWSPSGNFEAAKEWARAGYAGWPGAASTPAGDRTKYCTLPCSLTYGSVGYQSGPFTVHWYPHGFRGQAALGK